MKRASYITVALLAILSFGFIPNNNYFKVLAASQTTIWEGYDSYGVHMKVLFYSTGAFEEYDTNKEGKVFHFTGTWRYAGSAVYMKGGDAGSDKYSFENIGTIEGSVMKGVTRNEKGQEWTWELRQD